MGNGYLDKFPLLWEGDSIGELAVERESLYTWFDVRCRLPGEGLWCAWAVGEGGSLRLGGGSGAVRAGGRHTAAVLSSYDRTLGETGAGRDPACGGWLGRVEICTGPGDCIPCSMAAKAAAWDGGCADPPAGGGAEVFGTAL